VTNGVAPASKPITFNSGGTFYWEAVYSGDPTTNTSGSHSACASEPLTVTVPPPVSQITPTSTTCSQFASGTSGTLGTVFYSTKGTGTTATISSDNPGVLFYWVKVTATAGQSFTITQTTTYNPTPKSSAYFTLANGSFVYTNPGCTTVGGTTITQSPTTGAVTVTFAAAGNYIIGIKYSTKSVVGSGPASTVSGFSYQYTFSMGTTATTSGVQLQHS
jgi:hypothetical protein